MAQVMALFTEQSDRRNREELWRRYIANIVPMWGGKEAQTFADVISDYEKALRANDRDTVAEAYDNARRTLAAFEHKR